MVRFASWLHGDIPHIRYTFRHRFDRFVCSHWHFDIK